MFMSIILQTTGLQCPVPPSTCSPGRAAPQPALKRASLSYSTPGVRAAASVTTSAIITGILAPTDPDKGRGDTRDSGDSQV